MNLDKELAGSHKANNSELTQGCKEFIVPQARTERSTYHMWAMGSVLESYHFTCKRQGGWW